MVKALVLAAAMAVSVNAFVIRPTVAATEVPTVPATEAPTTPPTEDPLTMVHEATFSDYTRSDTCASVALRTSSCFTANGRSYRFGCRVGSTAVLTDVCESGCTNCNNNWSNEGEKIDTCYDDGSVLFQYHCSAPVAPVPVIPTAAVEVPTSEPQNPTETPKEEGRLTCSELGWLPDGGSTKVCAASRVAPDSPTQCSGMTNFYSANALCKAAGARLCSSAELSNDEAVGTGCKYDDARVWSSTNCDDGKGRITQAGARKGLMADGVECTAVTARTGAVRCCADVTIGARNEPSGEADINGYPSGYAPAMSNEFQEADGTCGANPMIRSSSCWVAPNGLANRYACSSGDKTVYFQSCGMDSNCSPASCAGTWSTDFERVGDCYSGEGIFYQYQCSI